MMEKGKTIILTVLVIASVLQSYYLAYSTPKFVPVEKLDTDYVKTELMGTEEKAENLIFPEQIIVHYGGSKHTVLYPDTSFYNFIFKALQKRELGGFQRNSVLSYDWDEIRNNDEGIELNFGRAIPLQLLQKIMQVKSEALLLNDAIEKVWIFAKNTHEDVRTVFFSQDGNTVYESTKADLFYKDIEQYLGYVQYRDGERSEFGTTYHTVNGKYYVPDQSLQMIRYSVPYTVFTPEQMQKNLFVDPGITRNIMERDGSEIYTDGKRGLQVKTEQKWMSYSDPVAPADAPTDLSENLYSAVQFINQHGGWNGKYRFGNVPDGRTDGSIISFQQYYGAAPSGSYPIVSESKFNFGYMKMTLQQGLVSNYERTLINLDRTAADKKIVRLEGGAVLDNMIESFPARALIRNVFPAYRPVYDEKHVLLLPVWAVELTDGSRQYLK